MVGEKAPCARGPAQGPVCSHPTANERPTRLLERGPGLALGSRASDSRRHARPSAATAAIAASRVARDERVLDVGCGCVGTPRSRSPSAWVRGGGVGRRSRFLGAARDPCAREARGPRPTCRSSRAMLPPESWFFDQGAFDLIFSPASASCSSPIPPLRSPISAVRSAPAGVWRSRAGARSRRTHGRGSRSKLRRGSWAAPSPPLPDAAGPFSFGDPKRVRGALEDAGFRDVAMVAFDATNSFGGSGSLGDAARDLARLGPVARLLVDRDERDVAKALAAIEAALPSVHRGAGRSVVSRSCLDCHGGEVAPTSPSPRSSRSSPRRPFRLRCPRGEDAHPPRRTHGPPVRTRLARALDTHFRPKTRISRR